MPPNMYPGRWERAVAKQSTWGGGPPRRSNTRNLVLGGIGIFVAAMLVGTVVGWLNAGRANADLPIQSSTTPPPNTDPTLPSPSGPSFTPSPTPSEPTEEELEQQAYYALEQQAAADLQRTSLDGQWVAQLSSKYVGVRDPRQETRSGSHKFKAVDILAEHQDLHYSFDGQYDIRLLRGQTSALVRPTTARPSGTPSSSGISGPAALSSPSAGLPFPA